MQKYELAYDIKLFAVTRVSVEAESLADARSKAEKILPDILDSMDLSPAFVDGYNSASGADVKLTEASLHEDDEGGPYLTEVNGKDGLCNPRTDAEMAEQLA